ncbi:hypothetical protein ACQEU8_20125 [Streptomyces sp. CA-250714]|uniref:hypothetical protein n=1 Tax=Streptomyces sp. CA-250714 TaxID=3240060 RepID=UPI003D8D96D3
MNDRTLVGRRSRLRAGLLGVAAVAATLAASPAQADDTADAANLLPVICPTVQDVDVLMMKSLKDWRTDQCHDKSDNDTRNRTSFS